MKAVVWHGPGNIDFEEVPDAQVRDSRDAVVRLTVSAICGTCSYDTVPTQVARWSVRALAKAGTLGIIGVYPPSLAHWPIGEAMNRNLTVHMGNCHHRAYIPKLIGLVTSGVLDPVSVLTQIEPMGDVLEAYRTFDHRRPGWVKVALDTAA